MNGLKIVICILLVVAAIVTFAAVLMIRSRKGGSGQSDYNEQEWYDKEIFGDMPTPPEQ